MLILIGLAMGAFLSYRFIFPADYWLSLNIANLTIGDILRVFCGVMVTLLGGIVGDLAAGLWTSVKRER